MATEIEAAELLIKQACDLKMRGLPMTKEAAMAKYYASEVSVKVSTEAIQILAGMDIRKISRWRNFTATVNCTIGEGTSEIQKLVIGREILKIIEKKTQFYPRSPVLGVLC